MIGIRMSRMIASGATLSASSRPASADMRGRDLETLELQHPGERVRHGPVIVHDEDRARGRARGMTLGRRNHRIILRANDIHVKKQAWISGSSGYTIAADCLNADGSPLL